MRSAIFVFAALAPLGLLSAQEDSKPLTPEEALKKVDERVTVQMEVKSTGGNTARYLNSDANYRSDKNFAIFIPQNALAKFHKADIDEPAQYYKGKTIQVTGTVELASSKTTSNRPQIRVEDPAQIKVIDKDAEDAKAKAPPKAVKGKGVKPK
jgi:DNA/RNA endonuclease YhcR with UshA esterase domain